jgi:hypothetical protein
VSRSARIARYGGFADFYAAHLGPFAGRATPVLQALLGLGRGTCLELGSGQGSHLDAIAELGWRAWAPTRRRRPSPSPGPSCDQPARR